MASLFVLPVVTGMILEIIMQVIGTVDNVVTQAVQRSEVSSVLVGIHIFSSFCWIASGVPLASFMLTCSSSLMHLMCRSLMSKNLWLRFCNRKLHGRLVGLEISFMGD